MIEGITRLATGADIAWRRFEADDRPAIVLVRGLGTQLIDWPDALIDGLVDAGLQVLVFDNRDAGLSQKFTGTPDLRGVATGDVQPPYTIAQMADDIPALMDALEVPEAILLGISMGGMVGQVAVAQHPHRFTHFFSVMSSSGRPGLPGPTPAANAALQAETDPGASIEDKIMAAVRGLKVCGSPGYPVPEEDLVAQVRARFERNHCPDGAHRQMAAVLACGDRTPLLQSISVPTLVIHGEEDPLIPLAAGEDTAASIPGARLVAVPGMGHDLPPALMPDLVQMILGFIDA